MTARRVRFVFRCFAVGGLGGAALAPPPSRGLGAAVCTEPGTPSDSCLAVFACAKNGETRVRGFSVVELLIALLVSSVVVMGAFYVLLNQQRTFSTTAGDRVVLSDMSAWDGYDRIRLR